MGTIPIMGDPTLMTSSNPDYRPIPSYWMLGLQDTNGPKGALEEHTQLITKVMSNASTYEAIMINSILVAITIISVRALVRTMLVVNDRIPTDSLRKIRIHWLLYEKRKNGHWDANNISWSQLFSIPLLSALPLFSGSLPGSFQGTASPQKALGCWHHPSPGELREIFFFQHPETLLPGKDLIG